MQKLVVQASIRNSEKEGTNERLMKILVRRASLGVDSSLDERLWNIEISISDEFSMGGEYLFDNETTKAMP